MPRPRPDDTAMQPTNALSGFLGDGSNFTSSGIKMLDTLGSRNGDYQGQCRRFVPFSISLSGMDV